MKALHKQNDVRTLRNPGHCRSSPTLRSMASQELSSTPTDAQLVQSLIGGDERALGELYDRHAALSYGLALSMMKDPSEAEEVVADAFSQIWRTADSFDVERGSFAAWVATITRSRALDRLRARQRGTRLLDSAASTDEDGFALPLHSPAAPDRQVEQSETALIVRRSLAELPDSQRQVLELAYFSGLSQTEIAEQLQEPLGTVKSRIRTGMEKLRQMLTPLMQEEAR